MPDLDPQTVTRGTNPENTADTLDKQQLAADHALIVFAVHSYNPNAELHYRTDAEAVLDVLVLSGRHRARREREWRVFGNLARQAGTQLPGVSVVARVTSGPAKTAGSTWYGLDFDVTDDELDTARRGIAWVAQQAVPVAPAPPVDDQPPF